MKKFLFFIGVIAATSIFAGSDNRKEKECVPSKTQKCFKQGEPMIGCGSAFNSPASIDVTQKRWKNYSPDAAFFVDASFIYWYAGQDGMAIAETGVLNSGTLYYPQNIKTMFQNFNYKPGFKIGGGITLSHEWNLFFEYTWFRGTNRTSRSTNSNTVLTAGTAAALSGTDVWVINDWFLQGTPAAQALSGTRVSSSWKLSMDLVDLLASRPYYQARKLIISPFGGLQLAFIRQWINVKLTESSALFDGALPVQPIKSRNHSDSWAIGPKMGAGTEFLLPYGMRFEGNLSASLLYMNYDVNHTEDAASTGFNTGPYTASYSNYGSLRPVLEGALGFGWGTYFYDQDFYISFSADYDFKLFWAQNMIRKLLDDTLTGTGPASSDLYLHGLTLKGRFDF